MVLALLGVNKDQYLAVILLLMLILTTGNGGKWIPFAEGSGTGTGGGGGGGGFWYAAAPTSNVGIAIALTAMAGLALAAAVLYTHRGSLKSPWSRRRRKRALLAKQWKSFFTPDGRLIEGGVKFLKKARSGGVDPSIRAEVWPFLLGVKEYESLLKECSKLHRRSLRNSKFKETAENSSNEGSGDFSQVLDSPGFEDVASSRRSISSERGSPAAEDLYPPLYDDTPRSSRLLLEGEGDKSLFTLEETCAGDTESNDSDSSVETENVPLLSTEEAGGNEVLNAEENSKEIDSNSKSHIDEDFVTWQRIIRLDAVRANDEWTAYSPSQAAVSEIKAQRLAQAVGLKDYNHLEPCRIYHAARLVAILEAYALYDPEIGYCQGMSDLLSPIVSVLEEDHEAFWCFVGFMKKARHNFRLDEVGIRRQLSIVSKIIKGKAIHLYRHLEKLEAEDCFFVYRMVVVLFRRELTFEQTLCLWEVMWADQAAIRAGIAKSVWGRMRLRAPPTDDLLLYAIAACVLQRRKLILEKYSSMDEIMRECNSMAGHLDVWKLLDDAHDLVVTFHDKIEETCNAH
ncbi:rab GTPase-activating protein 22-like isoform X2 [Mangifera indica]|uniref:rab GTPase-activating protein 22-like isoform X2 n=1 Tax=Mangifera indica TaxID=29780 RepID=UPI001CF9728F|nr:rab GTPase-activating protein 22-like isoform X2 [Mangifera indica]